MQPTWDISGTNECCRLMQCIRRGNKDGKRVQGTNTMFFINKKDIPPDCVATYARCLCTYRPEK